MSDRLEDVIEHQLAHFRKVNAMLGTGTMSTHMGNKDTTQDTIEENMVIIANLENALRDHKMRNA